MRRLSYESEDRFLARHLLERLKKKKRPERAAAGISCCTVTLRAFIFRFYSVSQVCFSGVWSVVCRLISFDHVCKKCIEVHMVQLCTTGDVVPVTACRKALVLELLLHGLEVQVLRGL